MKQIVLILSVLSTVACTHPVASSDEAQSALTTSSCDVAALRTSLVETAPGFATRADVEGFVSCLETEPFWTAYDTWHAAGEPRGTKWFGTATGHAWVCAARAQTTVDALDDGWFAATESLVAPHQTLACSVQDPGAAAPKYGAAAEVFAVIPAAGAQPGPWTVTHSGHSRTFRYGG